MESLNVKNINDEKIFNVIDPNGQGEVVNRIRPISISINQKAETINDQTDSTINLAVYWNDTWKSILDLTFDESLRQEYGKLTQDLTNIQKDIDMKQYKDAETKTADFLKYVANLSSKYTAIPEKAVVSKTKNDFVKIKADKNSVKVAISDKLLNFMLKKYAKVDNLDYTKSNECFSTSKFNCLANNYDIYYHSPEIFQKQAYMTVVKDNKVVGSYKVNYDQFSKFASKFMLTPQKLGYSKDRLAGYMKTAEVVMQNIFFDSVDEAKEWQEMVDEKKKEQATTPEGEEETTETTTTETKTEMGEGKSESPIKEDGGLARPSEDFASDEIPESEPRQQEQQGGGQNLGASRRLNLLKKKALKYPVGTELELKDGRYAIVKGRTYGAGGVETEEYVTVVIPEEDDHEEEISTEDIKNVVNVASKRKIKNTKKAKVGYNAEPENMEEEVAIELADELMSAANVALEKAGLLLGGYSGEEQRRQRVDVQKNAIEPLLKGRLKESIQGKVIALIKEHLTDLNYHTLVSAIEEIMDGKQASKKVKLTKKAGVDITVSTGNVYTLLGMLGKYCLIQPKIIDGKNSNKPSFKLECKPEEVKEVIEKWKDPGYMYGKANKGKNLEKKAKEYKRYNVIVKFNDKQEEYEFENDNEFLALDEALGYFGEKWHELPLANEIEKLEEIKVQELDVDDTVLNEYAKEYFVKNKDKFPKYSCNKKALYGDVQEQDIVPAKTETKVYLQSEKVEDFVWLINGSGTIEILAPKALVMGATGSGDNSEGVNKLRDYIKKDLEKISVEEMQKTVSEYGIDNVKEMDKDELERYLVWLLAGDTADNLENRLADEEDLENIKAKNNPNVQKQAEEQIVEEKIEQQVGEDGDVKATIGVGDVVTVNFDLIDNSTSEFEKYEEFIGKPMLLMETDKEDINKVIIEETEYPFQRLTIDTDKVELFDDMKGTEIVVEDTDGDEMITTFEELPVVAKQCKVKSIHKAANITKKKANLTKKAINSLEDVAGLIDDILSDYDWYDYADQLEVGEKSHYENILADLQKDEKGTIEALFNRVSENDEEYSSPKIEQLKEYYNNKFSNGGK